MEAKTLLLLLKNACEFDVDKPIYVSVNNKLIPCNRISSYKDKIVIGTEKEDDKPCSTTWCEDCKYEKCGLRDIGLLPKIDKE